MEMSEAATLRKPSTNPKDAIGSLKLPLHLWPSEATALGCLGFLEGEGKYGRDNFIAGDGVVASIYVDACKRHLDAWFSGEETSPDMVQLEDGTWEKVDIPHLANALACLGILVKCIAHDKLVDDRGYDPTGAYRRFVDRLTPNVARIKRLFAGRKPKHWSIADNNVAAE